MLPPLLPVTDAAVLAQQVGGVALVVGCHTAKKAQIERAIATLELVNADVLGVVLNRLPVKGPDAYSYTYYGYAPTTETTPRRAGRLNEAKPSSSPQVEDAFDEILLGRASRRDA